MTVVTVLMVANAIICITRIVILVAVDMVVATSFIIAIGFDHICVVSLVVSVFVLAIFFVSMMNSCAMAVVSYGGLCIPFDWSNCVRWCSHEDFGLTNLIKVWISFASPVIISSIDQSIITK